MSKFVRVLKGYVDTDDNFRSVRDIYLNIDDISRIEPFTGGVYVVHLISNPDERLAVKELRVADLLF